MLSKVVRAPIIGFIYLIALMEIVMDSIANTIASLLSWDKLQLVASLVAFIAAQVILLTASMAIFPQIALSLCLGTLAGFAYWGYHQTHVNPRVETHTETVEQLIPYDQWPDQCYVCNSDIEHDMNVRGQLAIHKGEEEAKTKAAPLCESCTLTYSTLMDNHDTLVDIYDRRDRPVEL